MDATLESLGSQVVPPSFHQSSLESSLFGIQANDNTEDPERDNSHEPIGDTQDPSRDRKKWKTLRDFVDERGLEDVFESIEGERNALDETLAATEAHPATITSISNQIRSLLSTYLSTSNESRQTHAPNVTLSAAERPLQVDLLSKDVSALLAQQEQTSAGMASHLESLAAHYDQMATALKEKEAGEDIGEEDMEGTWTFVTNVVACEG